jgi:hypothetical protein
VTARPYRSLPALAAFLLFLLAGSLLVRGIAGGGPSMTPKEEMYCVYYAIAYPSQPPPTLSPLTLEQLLGRLDERFKPIAGRVTILSYGADENGFELRAAHAGEPGKTYTVNLYGLR